MDGAELKKKLHSLIDESTEEKLIEVYSMFENEYSDEFKADLEEEHADYKKGGEVISKHQLDEAIEKLLYGK